MTAFARRSQSLLTQHRSQRLADAGVERVVGDLRIVVGFPLGRGEVSTSPFEQVPRLVRVSRDLLDVTAEDELFDHLAALLPRHALTARPTTGTKGRRLTSRRNGSSGVAQRSGGTMVVFTGRPSLACARSAAS